jgi:ABC-type multidrug transport system fused ATPase/permease subunit
MLGDIDLRDADLADIRSHIALVSQDIHVFNASVRDNIAYGTRRCIPD